MQFSEQRLAGVFAFIGGIECLIGISIAEELYPEYNVSSNYISDLGAYCRSGACNIVEPSSIIFNFSVALLGGLAITSSLFLYHAIRRRILAVLMVLSGVGAVGVGFFPETTGIFHVIFSLIVFLFGGLAAVSSFKVLRRPMNLFSVLLGVASLAALVLFSTGNYAGLGQGGMERMIAYPALLWFVGFGAYLMKP
jgi:hypothetical membrane protein